MTYVPAHPEVNASLVKRLWIYQAERFPIFKTALLLAVFSAASVSVSAHLGGRELPSILTLVSVWLITFIIFFQMRACDEWKDLEDDTKYRPQRPIPSGLISLRLVINIALAGVVIAIGAALNLHRLLLLPLGLIWFWLCLMTLEFFAPDWLKARPLAYLVSHMMIMPLIDLFITAAEWMPNASYPPAGIWIFLALSFVNGCILEIGRKVWAPESEIEGVETYSALWGPIRAVWLWVGLCVISWFLLLGVGYSIGAPIIVAGPGILALLIIVITAKNFTKSLKEKQEKAIENVAGLWAFVCYCLAGFGPIVSGWFLS